MFSVAPTMVLIMVTMFVKLFEQAVLSQIVKRSAQRDGRMPYLMQLNPKADTYQPPRRDLKTNFRRVSIRVAPRNRKASVIVATLHTK